MVQYRAHRLGKSTWIVPSAEDLQRGGKVGTEKSNVDSVYQRDYRERESGRSARYHILLPLINSLVDRRYGCELPSDDVHSYVSNMEKKVEDAIPGETKVAPDRQDESADSADDEMHEMNHHTNAAEFRGSTSSAAVIGYLQKTRYQRQDTKDHMRTNGPDQGPIEGRLNRTTTILSKRMNS
ncbi:hypothetical protein N7468_004738 [Penicillium chermesinum]|uniref:Uncharacterized protein n=1 Tax=Penicillium chermesinum TaxID=63820 RepID=A0A9W9P944_9EURO|nr:uncharacterized protein N7468_004738 [Penicillium chermesinum]KAJ5240119.1 hypothetical protein N7468_004738 [Penicillium chermesinum]